MFLPMNQHQPQFTRACWPDLTLRGHLCGVWWRTYDLLTRSCGLISSHCSLLNLQRIRIEPIQWNGGFKKQTWENHGKYSHNSAPPGPPTTATWPDETIVSNANFGYIQFYLFPEHTCVPTLWAVFPSIILYWLVYRDSPFLDYCSTQYIG